MAISLTPACSELVGAYLQDGLYNFVELLFRQLVLVNGGNLVLFVFIAKGFTLPHFIFK